MSKKNNKWKFKENVLKLSQCQNDPEYLNEWEIHSDKREGIDHCVCSNTNLKYYWIGYNHVTENFIEVGGGCRKKFKKKNEKISRKVMYQ